MSKSKKILKFMSEAAIEIGKIVIGKTVEITIEIIIGHVFESWRGLPQPRSGNSDTTKDSTPLSRGENSTNIYTPPPGGSNDTQRGNTTQPTKR